MIIINLNFLLHFSRDINSGLELTDKVISTLKMFDLGTIVCMHGFQALLGITNMRLILQLNQVLNLSKQSSIGLTFQRRKRIATLKTNKVISYMSKTSFNI